MGVCPLSRWRRSSLRVSAVKVPRTFPGSILRKLSVGGFLLASLLPASVSPVRPLLRGRFSSSTRRQKREIARAVCLDVALFVTDLLVPCDGIAISSPPVRPSARPRARHQRAAAKQEPRRRPPYIDVVVAVSVCSQFAQSYSASNRILIFRSRTGRFCKPLANFIVASFCKFTSSRQLAGRNTSFYE